MVETWELLHFAAQENDVEQIENILSSRGARVDVDADDFNTPLHIACASDSIQAILVLILYGAHVHLRNEQLQTPLDLLHDDIIKESGFLILSQIIISLRSKNGRYRSLIRNKSFLKFLARLPIISEEQMNIILSIVNHSPLSIVVEEAIIIRYNWNLEHNLYLAGE